MSDEQRKHPSTPWVAQVSAEPHHGKRKWRLELLATLQAADDLQIIKRIWEHS